MDLKDKNLLAYYEMNKASVNKNINNKANSKHNISFLETWVTNKQPAKDYAYSFAVVGDTQKLCQDNPSAMKGIYDWIIANKESKNIQHVFGLGDITEYWGKTTPEQLDEWTRAKTYVSQLDGVVSYSLVRGNHDESNLFNQTFNYSGYTNLSLTGLFKKSSFPPPVAT